MVRINRNVVGSLFPRKIQQNLEGLKGKTAFEKVHVNTEDVVKIIIDDVENLDIDIGDYEEHEPVKEGGDDNLQRQPREPGDSGQGIAISSLGDDE